MNIVIGTTTLYPEGLSEPRVQMALKMVRAARELGYRVVVVEDGSSPDVAEALGQAEAEVVARENPGTGMGPGRRQALRLAAEAAGVGGVAFWMEPERYPLMPFIGQICQPIINGEADLVIVGRKSLASYPKAQQMCEVVGNFNFQLLTGKPWDVYFGPRAFRSDAVRVFLGYQGEYGDKWDSIFVPVMRAMKEGLRVVEVRVDFIYPPEQKELEDKDPTFMAKRIYGLYLLTRASALEAGYRWFD